MLSIKRLVYLGIFLGCSSRMVLDQFPFALPNGNTASSRIRQPQYMMASQTTSRNVTPPEIMPY